MTKRQLALCIHDMIMKQKLEEVNDFHQIQYLSRREVLDKIEALCYQEGYIATDEGASPRIKWEMSKEGKNE